VAADLFKRQEHPGEEARRLFAGFARSKHPTRVNARKKVIAQREVLEKKEGGNEQEFRHSNPSSKL